MPTIQIGAKSNFNRLKKSESLPWSLTNNSSRLQLSEEAKKWRKDITHGSDLRDSFNLNRQNENEINIVG